MLNTVRGLYITMSVLYLKKLNSLQNCTVIFSGAKVVIWEVPKA